MTDFISTEPYSAGDVVVAEVEESGFWYKLLRFLHLTEKRMLRSPFECMNPDELQQVLAILNKESVLPTVEMPRTLEDRVWDLERRVAKLEEPVP
jgi:hypothetical protein